MSPQVSSFNGILKGRCPNMNHGKTNPPIAYCPNCGEKFNSGKIGNKNCNDESHRSKRKDRNHFCFDCGKDLTKTDKF